MGVSGVRGRHEVAPFARTTEDPLAPHLQGLAEECSRDTEMGAYTMGQDHSDRAVKMDDC